MKTSLRYFFCASLAVGLLATSCGTIKTIHVWKDDSYRTRLQKVLVIAVAEQDFMRDHFENVFCERLVARGVEAVAGNKAFPQLKGNLQREAIQAKVKEMGFSSVLVARSVSKKEVTEYTPGSIYLVPTAFQQDWYGFYADSFAIVTLSGRQYDAEFFNLLTNIYDVGSEKLVWSYLSEVKVENSREGAINPFIDTLMKQLEDGKLL